MNTILTFLKGVFAFFRKKRPPTDTRKKPVQVYEDGPLMFKTIRHLLDDLDVTFKDLKIMEPKMHSMQRVVKKFGPFIVGEVHEEERFGDRMIGTTTGFKAYGLPSVLIATWTVKSMKRVYTKGDMEDVIQHYFCAVKNRSIPILKRSNCSYYECAVVICVMPGDMKKITKPTPIEIYFYMEIDKKTGEANALATPRQEVTRIPNTSRAKYPTQFTTTEWSMPDLINKSDRPGPHSHAQIKKHLEQLFCMGYSLVLKREYGVNVIVKKGKRRATFTVPQNRWKYFFKDRIKAKNKNGNTKPIYHAVITHERQTKTKLTIVKTHYRGLRHFWWNGYEIRIVMQGKHGKSQASFGFSTFDEADVETGTKTFEIGNAAAAINSVFEGTHDVDLPEPEVAP